MNLIGIGSGILICAGLCLIFWLQRDTAVTETVTEERFVGEVRTLLKDYYPNTELTYNSETDTFAPTDVSIDNPRLFLGNLRPRTEDMSKSDASPLFAHFWRKSRKRQTSRQTYCAKISLCETAHQKNFPIGKFR